MKEYLNKQLKLREENLKYDFLPSMIEVIEHPTNRLCTAILFLIIIMIISAVIWAAMFQIDIVVTSIGTVTPEDGIVTLNSVGGGRICEICVADGEDVKKGDVILKLDATKAELNLLECQYNLKILEIQREMYGNVYDCLISDEENLLETIDTNSFGKYAPIADAILLENEIFLAELDDLENEEDRENAKQEQILAILKNMNTLDTKMESAKLSLENAELELSYYIVTAPADGQVTHPTALYEGLFVNAGDSVGWLLSKEMDNIFTSYVSHGDIGRIMEGDTVNIKIAAYKDTEYEYIKGTIESIGKVAVDIENIGAAYMVKIRIQNPPKDVKSGMEGSCDIIIGQRSVLDYFLEPFRDGLHNSLKER